MGQIRFAGFALFILMIYVMNKNRIQLVFMASKHKFLKAGFLAYILNISVIFGFWTNYNMWISS